MGSKHVLLGVQFCALLEGALFGCAADVELPDGQADDHSLAEVRLALKGGTSTASKPAIGLLNFNWGGCGGTLISPSHVLTAAHCNLRSDTLTGTNTFTTGGQSRNLTRIYTFGGVVTEGQGLPPGNKALNTDVAIVELDAPIPGTVAAPIALAAAPPGDGAAVTAYGYGPSDAGCANPFGTKRYLEFTYQGGGDGSGVSFTCPGDSGGPATYGAHPDNGAIWGVASYEPATGVVWGDVSHVKEDVMSVIRLWDNGGAGGHAGLEAGFRRNGVALATHNNTSASQCRELCSDDTTCNSFSHTTSSNQCQLFRSAGDWIADANATSGLSSARRFEVNVDRAGHDYRTLESTLEECSATCDGESRCAAFSWVQSTGVCWLKDYLGIGSAATGVTSGTRRGFEFYADREGSDYRSFEPSPPDPRTCQQACVTDDNCKAFTYRHPVYTAARPPVEQSAASCWLKDTVPERSTVVAEPPERRKRLITGRKRSTP